jgi:hypothetical protein
MINPDNPNFPQLGKDLERAIVKKKAESAFMEIATGFRGVPYPPGQAGLQQAIVDMYAQRKAIIIPAIDPYEVSSMVARRDPHIQQIGYVAISAAEREDYATAFRETNRLHLFAEASQQDKLDEGEALYSALVTQRNVTSHIMEHVLKNEPPLQEYFASVLPFLETTVMSQNQEGEYQVLRNIAHELAYNGRLGSEVRELFDPFAFASTRIVTGYA